MKHQHNKRQAITLSVLLSLLLISAISCSGGGGGGASSSDNATVGNGGSTSGSGSGNSGTSGLTSTVNIPISFNEVSSLSLVGNGTASVDSFLILLQNCSSGLTGSNSTPGVLNVYLSDTNCLGELSSFVLNGQSYVPSGTGSSPFTTWLAGNNAVFVGANANDLVAVRVLSQLSSPILSTDTISYEFSIIDSSSTVGVVNTPTAISLSVSGEYAPNFEITSGNAVLNGLVTSGPSIGDGIFTFKLTCSTGAMTVGANASFNSFCPAVTPAGTLAGGAAGVDIGSTSNFSYKIITDINSNGTLTLAQAQSTFTAGGDTNVNLSTDILSGSTGFQISSIDGPGPIATHSNFILVLQAKNPLNPSNSSFSSFQYFPISVQTFNP